MNKKCPECNEYKITFNRKNNEYMCTNCGCIIDEGAKLKKRSLLRILLIPNDAELIEKDGIFEIDYQCAKIFSLAYLKRLLLSFKNVEIDNRFIKNKNQEDCYYKIKIDEENICIEINEGNRNFSNKLTRISLATQPRLPSPKTFSKLLELVEYIIPKTSMKILDSWDGKITSLHELRKNMIIYTSTDESRKSGDYTSYI